MSVSTLTKAEDAAASPPRSKKKLLVLVVLVAVAAAAGWWFVLRPAPAPAEPEPGAMTTLEPIQINLAGGHYLRLGLALQATAETTEELDGGIALDEAINLLSGKPVSEVSQPVQRKRLKAELLERLQKPYEHEVMGVYFTDFVTQ